ncbi:MAG: hypothetical protein K0S07_859 [Chlamydiales bacterium]|jgi:hypothetical protein|nr:hypothetical protein [Chlamydiales bacterium]
MNKPFLFCQRQSLIAGLSFCLLALLPSCQPREAEPLPLIEEEAPQPRLSEKTRADLMIEVVEEDPPHWQRQPYETIDDWTLRLQEQLSLNDLILNGLKENYEELTLKESETAEAIQDLIYKNQQMGTLLTQEKSQAARREKKLFGVNLPAPPFSFYLIKPKDTLYSIALKRFRNKEAMQNILLWNQGWIRYPTEIVAGQCLILFHEEGANRSLETANHYFKSLNEAIDQMKQEKLKAE